jgi:hypothetical protein
VVNLFRVGAVVALLICQPVWSDELESGLPYIEAVCANRLAIRNYDVSYDHWMGLSPREKDTSLKEDLPSQLKCRGRIVVDWKTTRILVVNQIEIEAGSAKSSSIWIDGYVDGKHQTLKPEEGFQSNKTKSDLSDVLRTRPIPLVEFLLESFPGTGIVMPREAFHEQWIQAFENSKLTRNLDGAVTIVGGANQVAKRRASIQFDPISAMPTKYKLELVDPTTGDVVKKLMSTTLQHEKAKEIYRLVSFDYSGIAPIKEGLKMDSHGTVSFQWNQFNEDEIQFPEFLNGDEQVDMLKVRLFLEARESK